MQNVIPHCLEGSTATATLTIIFKLLASLKKARFFSWGILNECELEWEENARKTGLRRIKSKWNSESKRFLHNWKKKQQKEDATGKGQENGECPFVNLLSKKENIYLCRSADSWTPYPWSQQSCYPYKNLNWKKMVSNQRESTFNNECNLNGNRFLTSVLQPNPS